MPASEACLQIRCMAAPQARRVPPGVLIVNGDGVNVAARLEALADPGGICISDAVRTAVGKGLSLDYEDMGTQECMRAPFPSTLHVRVHTRG